jgi:hypothetical protein
MTGKEMFLFVACLSLSPLPVFAQQGSSWQRPSGQPTPLPASSQELPSSAAPQWVPPLSPQVPGAGHPQVMEMPAVQVPVPAAQTPVPHVEQTVPPLHTPTEETVVVPRVAKPVYLGITGDTSPTCRYPAGVRISRVIEGSPAHQAGLKGEGTLSVKDALVGVLATSPAALFIAPLLSSSDHSRWGDLILAIDGKRVHNREEFENQMKHFQPGDVVYFSVLRERHGLKQVPVRLGEHLSVPPTTQEASITSATPGS